jgi:hypothetical protein
MFDSRKFTQNIAKLKIVAQNIARVFYSKQKILIKK